MTFLPGLYSIFWSLPDTVELCQFSISGMMPVYIGRFGSQKERIKYYDVMKTIFLTEIFAMAEKVHIETDLDGF